MSSTESPRKQSGPAASRAGGDGTVAEGPPPDRFRALVDGMARGKRVSLARAISVVENERPGFQELLHELLATGPRGAHRLGMTGPPGAGKSSIVATLARLCRERDETVGIVAVDPTSPYSGGALLGDRIRMNELATDPGIFIRSMASRGSLGGLATTTKEVVDVMEAFGFPRLFIETVGVGQTELEITGAADTVAVVLVPESGDGIQAMKAGLMEIADIFVINKADRPGADRLVREVRSALKLRSGRGTGGAGGHHGPAGHHGPPSRGPSDPDSESPEDRDDWTPPVLLTMAQSGEGVDELLEEVDRHREWLHRSGEIDTRRRRRAGDRIRDILDRELKRRVRVELAGAGVVAEALGRVEAGRSTPYTEAARLLRRMGLDADEAPLPDPDEPTPNPS